MRDRQLGTTERVSVVTGGAQAEGGEFFGSFSPSISADGRFVAFRSSATNLVPGVTEPGTFVRDRKIGMTEFVGPGDEASISADGRFVALRVTNNSSQTSNCPGLSGFKTCVFVHDRGPADN